MLRKIHSPVIPTFSAVVTEINTACLSQNPSWSKSTETKTLPCGASKFATSFNWDDSAIAGKTIVMPDKKTKLAIVNRCHPCLFTNMVYHSLKHKNAGKIASKTVPKRNQTVRKLTFDEQFMPHMTSILMKLWKDYHIGTFK